MFTKKRIDSLINKGIKQTIHEKDTFDNEFNNVSDRIAATKSEMKKKSMNRTLIRNK